MGMDYIKIRGKDEKRHVQSGGESALPGGCGAEIRGRQNRRGSDHQ